MSNTIATIQYGSYEEMMATLPSQSIDSIRAEMGVSLPRGTYIYANTRNQIEAASVARDAYPSDEVYFIGRT